MNSIDSYFKSVRKFKVLTKEQEVELARRIQEGDKEALDTFVESNLRFVISVARTFQGRGLSLEDLIAEGNVGLIEAAKHFDPEAGFRFVSYGVFWIRQSILAALSNNRSIRLPFNKVGTLNKVVKAVNFLSKKNGVIPSDKELSEYLNLPIYEIEDIRKVSKQIVSLETPLGESEDDGTLECILPGPVDLEADVNSKKYSLVEDIERILTSFLSDKDCAIIRYSFGIGCEEKSDEEIAKKMNISPERVRQVRLNILSKIRKNVKAVAILKEYLG